MFVIVVVIVVYYRRIDYACNSIIIIAAVYAVVVVVVSGVRSSSLKSNRSFVAYTAAVIITIHVALISMSRMLPLISLLIQRRR